MTAHQTLLDGHVERDQLEEAYSIARIMYRHSRGADVHAVTHALLKACEAAPTDSRTVAIAEYARDKLYEKDPSAPRIGVNALLTVYCKNNVWNKAFDVLSSASDAKESLGTLLATIITHAANDQVVLTRLAKVCACYCVHVWECISVLVYVLVSDCMYLSLSANLCSL
jgi:pentatricopeptide repeat protein